MDDIAVIEKVNGKNHIDWSIKQDNTNEHIQGHIKWVGDDGTLMTAGKSGKIPPGILKKYSDLQDDTTNTGGNTDKYERNQYFFHPDHLGSTSFITDASGEVSQHVEYLPFGEILVDDRPVNDKNPYLYNGKELDEETGLYYYGARFYDPQIARWITIDPKAEKYYSISPYVYVADNPIRLIDPNGKEIYIIINGKKYIYSPMLKINGMNEKMTRATNNLLKAIDRYGKTKVGMAMLKQFKGKDAAYDAYIAFAPSDNKSFKDENLKGKTYEEFDMKTGEYSLPTKNNKIAISDDLFGKVFNGISIDKGKEKTSGVFLLSQENFSESYKNSQPFAPGVNHVGRCAMTVNNELNHIKMSIEEGNTGAANQENRIRIGEIRLGKQLLDLQN